jgi:hypothetical protein
MSIDTPNLRRLDANLVKKRQVYVLRLAHLRDFPNRLEIPCPRFVLFVAADFTEGDGDSSFANQVLDAGCVYFCAWGKGCESMHDLVDDGIIERENGEPGHIITTWHSDEALADAVEFALFSAEPDDVFSNECRAVVLAVAGNDAWGMEIEANATLLSRDGPI